MIGYFPTPYPNETIYSVLARYFQHLDNFGLYPVMKKVYHRIAILPDGLPNNIEKLLANTPLGYSYTNNEMLLSHTLYNFYAIFAGQDKRKELYNKMLQDGRTDSILSAGLNFGSNKWNSPRFCPKCLKEDIQLYGEPYWHLEHQIPGLKTCPHHHEVTYDVALAGVFDNSGKRRAFIALDGTWDDGRYTLDKVPTRSETTFRKHILLSINSWKVLNFNGHYELADMKRKYHVKLRELGYSGVSKVQIQRFREDFINYYGEEFLSELGCKIESGKQNWLFKTLRANAFRHPIKHLLVIIFLFGSFEDFQLSFEEYRPFGEPPWLCLNPLSDHYKERVVQRCELKQTRLRSYGVFSCDCGFTYKREIGEKTKPEDEYSDILSFGSYFEERLNEMSQKEGISNRELLESIGFSKYAAIGLVTRRKTGKPTDTKKVAYREVIGGLIENNLDTMRSQVRKKADKEYQWLLQHDREWLEQQLPEPSGKRPYEYRRTTNWEKLDNDTCARLCDTAQYIRSKLGKPRRVTKNLLLKQARAAKIIKFKTRYSKSLKQLENLAESRDDYQIRCINWAVTELRNSGDAIKENTIRDMTRIRTDASSKVTSFIKEIVALPREDF